MLRKLAALLIGLVMAAVLAEVGFRVLRPGDFDRPFLRTADGERKADLSQVIGFMNQVEGDGSQSEGPRSNLASGFFVRGCYDRPRWDYFDDEGCVDYRTNAFGFRDEEWTLDKPDGQHRIVAIGDSFTFGLGVQLEDTWAKRLQHQLAADRGQDVLVVNAGFVGGHMPTQYGPWLKEQSAQLDPDTVIIGLCLNDLGDIPMMAFEIAEEPSGSKAVDWVQRKLGRWRVARQLERSAEGTRKSFDYGKVIDRQPETWHATRDALTATGTLLEQRGVRLVVVILPMMSRLTDDDPFAPLHTLVREHCEEQGIEVIDLLPVFLGRRDTDLWVHPTDQHPNDVGHALIAGAVASWFAEHPKAPR